MSVVTELVNEMEGLHRPATVTFMSRRSNLRLVYVSGYETSDARGQKTSHTGKTLEFTQGRLIVDEQLAKRLGETLDDLLSWLRGHDRCGDSSDGFFELEAQVPDGSDVTAQIAGFAVEEDIEAIEAIAAVERENWNRDVVLMHADVALESIKAKHEREAAAAAEAEQAAQLAATEQAERDAREQAAAQKRAAAAAEREAAKKAAAKTAVEKPPAATE